MISDNTIEVFCYEYINNFTVFYYTFVSLSFFLNTELVTERTFQLKKKFPCMPLLENILQERYLLYVKFH